MKKNNIIKISIISLITLLVLSVLGLSYAYFSLLINGKSNNMVAKMGSLRLKYVDDDVISLNNVFPGDSLTKSVTVTNIGSLNAFYTLYWEELQNTFSNNELVIEAKCTRLNSDGIVEGTCDDVSSKPIKNIKIKSNIKIEPTITHKYDIKITFLDTGENQNYNKNANLSGKIGLREGVDNSPVYCYFDGDVEDGTEYVNGDYTYRYNQILRLGPSPSKSTDGKNITATFMSTNNDDFSAKKVMSYIYNWVDAKINGWSVTLTNRDSRDPVTSKVCTYINDKPVTSMAYMYAYASSDSIDLSSINTSNIIDMRYMFYNNGAYSLDLSDLDTKSVVSMSSMFEGAYASTLDLSNFDTSNVTDMNAMFKNSKAFTIDISSFNTSNVTDMAHMFYGSNVTSLDISNFNTSNVVYVSYMFASMNLSSLDLSKFSTNSITDMVDLFYKTKIKNINFKNFDTSKVINMDSMFEGATIDTLDLSNFNTSNVTNMETMFYYSNIDKIDLSSFDTSKVESFRLMFGSSKASVIDLSGFNTPNLKDFDRMFETCENLKTIYVTSDFDLSSLTYTSSHVFDDSTKLVGGAGTKYSSSRVSYTYARIDGGTSKHGYFTLKTT